MLKFLFIVIATLNIYAFDDFSVVQEEPLQKKAPRQKKVLGKYTLIMGDSYKLNARILAAKKYDWDELSSIIPVDLGVGWGRMSKTNVMNQFAWSQSGRFLRWSISMSKLKKARVSEKYMVSHVSNMHLIPAHPKIKQILQSLNKYDMIYIKGYLTDVYFQDKVVRSSIRRDDEGAGACEVVYVTGIKVKRSAYKPFNAL